MLDIEGTVNYKGHDVTFVEARVKHKSQITSKNLIHYLCHTSLLVWKGSRKKIKLNEPEEKLERAEFLAGGEAYKSSCEYKGE